MKGLYTRSNLLTFVVIAAIFYMIYGSWLFNFFGGVDDIMLNDREWIFLANGRWCSWIIKTIFGYGPQYPYGGILTGIMLAAAAVCQLDALGIKSLWQRITYSVIFLAIPQNIGNVSLWCLNACFAVGILLATLSAWVLLKETEHFIAVSTLLLTAALGCYQSLLIYFIVLLLAYVLLSYIREKDIDYASLARKAFLVVGASLITYFIIYKLGRALAPAQPIYAADVYQEGIVGWHEVSFSDFSGMVERIAKYAVILPLRQFIMLDHGKWLVGSGIICALAIAAHYICNKQTKKGLIVTLGILALNFLPFAFCPVLLSNLGVAARLMIAQPAAIASIWVITAIIYTPMLLPHRNACALALIFIVSQATWNSGEAARNRLFRYERALEELRDMYMLGRVEAMRHGLNECDILLCGRNQHNWNTGNNNRKNRPIFDFSNIFADVDTASTFIFKTSRGTQYHPSFYATFLRIPSRFRLPSSEETAEHAETLAAMPSWPADGSIRADGKVVLIKIGPEIDEGEP
ncbi:MAG: glucosyltransferase domain-containing protein [Akkermansia sp.]|nr:glucosyltransferase domain-containing protein [Akkermansia sp.]